MGGILLAAGCRKQEEFPRSGNARKLWEAAMSRAKAEEPLNPVYAKDTPAFYRDASLGKEDPNFKPKVGGG